MQTYWFITVMEKFDIDEDFYVKTGCTRLWGFYSSKVDALQALHNNVTDMWETIYNFAILEEYYEGIGNSTGVRYFLKYDPSLNGYFEIEEPEYAKYICDFAIG